MELIFILIFMAFIYKKVKKAAGIQKKLSEFSPEDFKQLQAQGSVDLQKLLNNIDKVTHSNRTSKNHVHSDSDYNNKNYVSKKQKPIKIVGEPTVKRSVLDQRDSQETVIRKSYD